MCRVTGAEYHLGKDKIDVKITDSAEKIFFKFKIFNEKYLILLLNGKIKLKEFLSLYNPFEAKKIKEIFKILVENAYLEPSMHPIVIDRAI